MADKNTKATIVAVVVVALVALGWFFVSPLFVDEVVDEAFVFPTRAEVLAMSDEDRGAAMQRTMEAMEIAPDRTADETMVAESSPEVVRSGAFRDADGIHQGSGDALLYRLPNGSHVLRFENFRVTNGPALVVYLAKHPDPASASDVKEGFLDLGKLKGNIGNQNYDIPADADLTEFNSVVIWCELFDVLFSPAALIST